jgi:hypothetical protein
MILPFVPDDSKPSYLSNNEAPPPAKPYYLIEPLPALLLLLRSYESRWMTVRNQTVIMRIRTNMNEGSREIPFISRLCVGRFLVLQEQT